VLKVRAKERGRERGKSPRKTPSVSRLKNLEERSEAPGRELLWGGKTTSHIQGEKRNMYRTVSLQRLQRPLGNLGGVNVKGRFVAWGSVFSEKE